MMREHESTITDAGSPKFAVECGLGDRFRYWQGLRGRRHLFTAMPRAEIGDVERAIVIVAERAGDSGYRGVLTCAPGDPGEPGAGDIVAMLSADKRLVAFVHLLADDVGERQAILRDFRRQEQKLAA